MLPWPDERSRTFVPPPTVSRVVLEPRCAVPVCVRTEVRLDTPLSTATKLPRASVGPSESRRGLLS
jgi:hypothetical protein